MIIFSNGACTSNSLSRHMESRSPFSFLLVLFFLICVLLIPPHEKRQKCDFSLVQSNVLSEPFRTWLTKQEFHGGTTCRRRVRVWSWNEPAAGEAYHIRCKDCVNSASRQAHPKTWANFYYTKQTLSCSCQLPMSCPQPFVPGHADWASAASAACPSPIFGVTGPFNFTHTQQGVH